MPADFKSSRDIVGDVTRAVRAQGLRMGLYYAGGIDWTVVEKPVRTLTDLMEQQALGSEYARYAAAQWRELIDAYAPSILWNDMGWSADYDPQAIFSHYFDTVGDGLVNDATTMLCIWRWSAAPHVLATGALLTYVWYGYVLVHANADDLLAQLGFTLLALGLVYVVAKRQVHAQARNQVLTFEASRRTAAEARSM
jgi:alpha-L-fucosidase